MAHQSYKGTLNRTEFKYLQPKGPKGFGKVQFASIRPYIGDIQQDVLMSGAVLYGLEIT